MVQEKPLIESKTGDNYLDLKINREQAIKMKKQAKFDAIRKENIKLIQENKRLRKGLEKIRKIILGKE